MNIFPILAAVYGLRKGEVFHLDPADEFTPPDTRLYRFSNESLEVRETNLLWHWTDPTNLLNGIYVVRRGVKHE